jgi:hypothetical protein
MKYKVFDTTIPYLKNIDVELDLFSYKIGDTVTLFNEVLTVTQTGAIFCATNATATFSLVEVSQTSETDK